MTPRLYRIAEWLALVGLLGLALTMGLGKGPHRAFFDITAIAFFLLAGLHLKTEHRLPAGVVAAIGLSVCYLLLFTLNPQAEADPRTLRYIVAFAVISGALALLPGRPLLQARLHTPTLVLFLTTAAVVGVILMQWVTGRPHAFFINPHFLVFHCVMAVLLAGWFAVVMTDWRRYLAIATGLAALIQMLLLQSAIGFLSLVIAVGTLSLVYLRRPALVGGWVAAALVAVTLTLSVNWARSPDERLNAPVQESGYVLKDERSVLWIDTLRMQRDSELLAWFVGHGPDAFGDAYIQYSSFNRALDFVFPHNFFLEALYSFGLIGLIAFTLGLAVFTITFALDLYRSPTPRAQLGWMLFVAAFVYTFLSLPMLSRYPVYTLAFIVGYCLWQARMRERG